MEFVLTKEEVEAIGRFDRQISPEIRALLRRKRESLGASYQQLGNVLQISWSTIHKWETGTTNSCHSHHVERIRRFLQGILRQADHASSLRLCTQQSTQ